MFSLFTFLSCTETAIDVDVESTSTVKDSPLEAEYTFEEGILDPPFRHANSIWAGVALLDYDNDGWTDLFFTNGKSHADALYRNNGDGTFTDVAELAGVDSRRENGAVVAGDIDNDGDTDLIVNVHCSATTLSAEGEYIWDGDKIIYINNGDGTFVERSIVLSSEDEEHIRHCTFSLTLGDMNGDGYLDLIASDGHDPDTVSPWAFDKFHPGGENIIFFNNGTGTFDSTSNQIGHEGTFVGAHMDVDEDGLMDLIFGNSGQNIGIYYQNQFGDFIETPSASNTGRGLWMGMAIADFDNDSGWDIYATNQGLSPLIHGYDNLSYAWPNLGLVQYSSIPDLTQVTSPSLHRQWINPFHGILYNAEQQLIVDSAWSFEGMGTYAGDTFETISGRYDMWSDAKSFERLGWGWGAVALDVNADGWMDVAINQNACAAPMSVIESEDKGAGPGALLINTGNYQFVDKIWSSGIANEDEEGLYVDGRGLATGDLNNDGYADLVFANRAHNPSDDNPLAQKVGIPKIWLSQQRSGNYLQISLVGTQSNRDGIGSKVKIMTESKAQWQWMRPGGELNSSNESLLSFGLGDEDLVDIEVHFPSGNIVEHYNVSANQRVVIEENEQ